MAHQSRPLALRSTSPRGGADRQREGECHENGSRRLKIRSGKRDLVTPKIVPSRHLGWLGGGGAIMMLPEVLTGAPDGKRTFTVLHTNDLHSSLIGSFVLNGVKTRGGYGLHLRTHLRRGHGH